MSAPASARPRAMPSPMPPLPPVTMATLPLRSNNWDDMGCTFRFSSALALPDQDQADGCECRAIAGPLNLVDNEAGPWPGDHAGTLADPEQAHCQRQEAED